MKKFSYLFVALCLVLCLIPSVGMLFFPTTETTENKAMESFPEVLNKDGSLNTLFFKEFDSYFNQHIALRNPMLYLDAKIQTNVFAESNVSGVIYGTDGWLYYASTLDDYLGKNVMSERQLYNLAHNMTILQEYLDARDVDFVFTIAPNKNTLYGENMPYYNDYIVNAQHSAELLKPFLEQQGVKYLDLFTLFRSQDEVLYLKLDSHWNMKGANLVYDALMNELDLNHTIYTDPQAIISTSGDLNKMLYSFYGKGETDYTYDLPNNYDYANNANSVEDGWIITQSPLGTGTLLMFRDSFANTLIPFLSESFQTAYYSKGEPNALERYLNQYNPDCVVIEKVERNIANYLNAPPLITAPSAALPVTIRITDTASTAQVTDCENDMTFFQFSGSIDSDRMQTDSEILVRVNGKTYSAYHTGENGFVLYLKKADFKGETADVQAYIVDGDTAIEVISATLTLPE